MNIKKVFLVTMFSCMSLTGINNVAEAQFVDKSIKNPNNPEVLYMGRRNRIRVERSLDRNNCALFIGKGIKCAYGDAGTRNYILKAVDKGYARPFYGNGRTLRRYIRRVGINQVVVELQNLGINY